MRKVNAMKLELEPQNQAEPIDDATRDALDEAEAEVERGEVYTLDEVRESIKERSTAWRKTQETLLPA